MGLNELADRVEACIGLALSAEESLYPDVADIYLDRFEEHCRENQEIIIKALRFAAYMERLIEFGPWMDRFKDGMVELRISVKGKVEFFYGPDIYTAVRRAVEALEKGESDGN